MKTTARVVLVHFVTCEALYVDSVRVYHGQKVSPSRLYEELSRHRINPCNNVFEVVAAIDEDSRWAEQDQPPVLLDDLGSPPAESRRLVEPKWPEKVTE